MEPPTLIVAFGDLHVGSTTALCPPVVHLEDGGEYHASPLQRWYWECWQRLWDHVAHDKGRLNARVLAISGGDEIEGDHHYSTQAWFVNEADQDRALLEVYRLPQTVADQWVFLRGTPAHDGPIAARTEARLRTFIALGFSLLPASPTVLSHWLWTGTVSGVRIQAKHEPSTRSYAPHMRDMAAARQAHYLWEEYHQANLDPPHLALFHHLHYPARGDYQGLTVFFVPGWQAMTAYTWRRQAAPCIRPAGALIAAVSNGFWHADFRLYRPRRSIW